MKTNDCTDSERCKAEHRVSESETQHLIWISMISLNFLDMHQLILGACQVINQQPTLLVQSPELTSAPSKRQPKRGYRPCQWSWEQYKFTVSIHGGTRVEHMSNTQTRRDLCAHSDIAESKQGSQSIFALLLFLLNTNSIKLCNFPLKEWHYWKHAPTSSISKTTNTSIATRR